MYVYIIFYRRKAYNIINKLIIDKIPGYECQNSNFKINMNLISAFKIAKINASVRN